MGTVRVSYQRSRNVGVLERRGLLRDAVAGIGDSRVESRDQCSGIRYATQVDRDLDAIAIRETWPAEIEVRVAAECFRGDVCGVAHDGRSLAG